ncbi:uncharacterized protein EV422DRAFT_539645 [Fimicolochytrium jonesii]|uniref:uncharacterized protein n=1 Tax=Fimicolochytrium jonesii TaxID=1396493 RepID=UPI0022FE387E|nr:uncharacterized protein EV422DRAFT_539645 [Fimicolochytrium jonesii]KAI8818009.1 hypothetical protein EV422DRAFT_539645 [Fimicolochytrium jonesii]
MDLQQGIFLQSKHHSHSSTTIATLSTGTLGVVGLAATALSLGAPVASVAVLPILANRLLRQPLLLTVLTGVAIQSSRSRALKVSIIQLLLVLSVLIILVIVSLVFAEIGGGQRGRRAPTFAVARAFAGRTALKTQLTLALELLSGGFGVVPKFDCLLGLRVLGLSRHRILLLLLVGSILSLPLARRPRRPLLLRLLLLLLLLGLGQIFELTLRLRGVERRVLKLGSDGTGCLANHVMIERIEFC